MLILAFKPRSFIVMKSTDAETSFSVGLESDENFEK